MEAQQRLDRLRNEYYKYFRTTSEPYKDKLRAEIKLAEEEVKTSTAKEIFNKKLKQL